MEIATIVLLVLLILLQFHFSKKGQKEGELDLIKASILAGLKEEFFENRKELASSLKENREELSFQIERLTRNTDEKLIALRESIHSSNKENREELSKTLNQFRESFTQSVKDFNLLQVQKFEAMEKRQDVLVKATENQLEKMRITVDEKLHKTLEERLGQSFKLVSERLEAVQKGLGEMQTLANGVGDLKRVLTNVKTRGGLGEIQLGNILEQILAPEQYEANVKTKQGSNDLVEYAIKLPGKDDSGKVVYLPIDAKFPQEDYVRLQKASENGDKEGVDSAVKSLQASIKVFAKSIHDKYIDPPNTTDFGVMFLPIEGLFAEVVKHPELTEMLQRQYKIVVTGPTTLAAMLNSLQMGFKTLAIQKRSGEVWNVLGAVKTEFKKFGGVLEKAQKKINEANGELDKLVGTRTRMLMSKLRTVDELPQIEADQVLKEGIELPIGSVDDTE